MEKRVICLIAVIGLLLIGCVTPAKKGPETRPSTEKELFSTYVSKARESETRGDLLSARENYKLALTVNPQDKPVEAHLTRLEKDILAAAEAHYQTGLDLNSQGRYKEARDQFLMALALRPDYPEALEQIGAKKLPSFKKHIVHVVKPGETLSKLAQFYYEDFKKFPIIAKYNGLEDATQLRVGQEIRIPRLDGMDRVAGEDRNDLAAGEQDDRSETDEEAPVDQATIYRDLGVNLFMEQKYDEALIEFEKVLKTDPKDKMAIEFSYRAHYEIALALFKKKDYLTAKDQFASCLQYRADCQKCHAYIQKSEDLYKEIHYRKGIQYFEDEKLDDAIGEWKLVSAMDPDYRRTNYLIQKARTILKRVEEIKKRQAPGQDR